MTASLLPATRRPSAGQQGITLVEVVISVALLTILGITLLHGLATIARGRGIQDERVGALIAGRAQIESIAQATYDTSVAATPGPGYTSLPAQRAVGNITFDLQVIAQQIDTGVQLVTVAVSHGGKAVTRLQAYKVNRQ